MKKSKKPIKPIKKQKKEKKKEKERELSPKQELFCVYWASDREFFGNGVQSYIEAYDIDISMPGAYAVARTNASKLLTNANILKRINELLDLGTLNDSFVDKQLAIVINQNTDFGSKTRAINEYNKLKNRITERLQNLGKDGKPVDPGSMTIIVNPSKKDVEK